MVGGEEFGEAKVAEHQRAAVAGRVRVRQVDEAILKLDVAVDDPHVFVQVPHGAGQLVRVSSDEVGVQPLAVGPHDVEQGAAAVQLREAVRCERRNLDVEQWENVAVGETPPQPDLTLEILLQLLVFGLGLVLHVPANDLHRPDDAFVSFERVGFADDAESAEADLTAENVIPNLLTFRVWLGT